MAKHQRQVKAAQNRDLARLEQTEVFDDNLLPEASEIEKLSVIDSNILQWLKERAAKEQDFRHGAYEKRLKVLSNDSQREHNTVRYALTIYFLLVGGCVLASYFLLMDGKKLEGSIFGGAAALLALAVLITKGNPKKPQ